GRDPSTFPTDEKEVGWRDVESTAEQVRALGRRCLTQLGDVSNAGDVQRIMDAAVREFGKVDILVNNAATARGADRVPVVELSEELFRRTVEVKVVGTFLFSQAFARHAIERGGGGKIVNISSIAGKIGGANTAAYGASNAAAESLTRTLARELAKYNINVNCVCPGMTDTSRMDDLGRAGPGRQRRGDRRVHHLAVFAAGVVYYRSVHQHRWRHRDGAVDAGDVAPYPPAPFPQFWGQGVTDGDDGDGEGAAPSPVPVYRLALPPELGEGLGRGPSPSPAVLPRPPASCYHRNAAGRNRSGHRGGRRRERRWRWGTGGAPCCNGWNGPRRRRLSCSTAFGRCWWWRWRGRW
ncbi:MAG: SDR family NAD(P)-dependent oxidoreductase, partial [Chloroflexi bacterium]|nr:SDR family NAD(P)-dependent oxidoreductase [Chloroflexota bacterium]